jgi:hypothetical protein
MYPKYPKCHPPLYPPPLPNPPPLSVQRPCLLWPKLLKFDLNLRIWLKLLKFDLNYWNFLWVTQGESWRLTPRLPEWPNQARRGLPTQPQATFLYPTSAPPPKPTSLHPTQCHPIPLHASLPSMGWGWGAGFGFKKSATGALMNSSSSGGCTKATLQSFDDRANREPLKGVNSRNLGHKLKLELMKF